MPWRDLGVHWQTVLDAADISITPATAHEVTVELPSGARATLHVIRTSSTLHPSVMRHKERGTADGVRLLWVAAHAAPAAVRSVRERGDSLVTSAGMVLLQVDGETLEIGHPAARTGPARRGPAPWGAIAVARRLLQVDVDRQQDLALLAGISQARVSRLLARLRERGLTAPAHTPGRRPVERPVSATTLLDWWLDTYPRDEALRAHYVAPDPLPEQLARAAAALRTRRPLLSGDLACDQLAPWRRPGLVLLYCAHPIDLTDAGFIASTPAQATVTVVTSPDPTVALPITDAGHTWLEAPAGEGSVEVADPFQVLLDALGSPTPDAPEAAGRLRDELLTGHTRNRVRRWLQNVVQQHVATPAGSCS